MVVSSASCFRRGRRSICLQPPQHVTAVLAWWLDRERLVGMQQLLDRHIKRGSETQSHLCVEPQLARLVIRNHNLDDADALG